MKRIEKYLEELKGKFANVPEGSDPIWIPSCIDLVTRIESELIDLIDENVDLSDENWSLEREIRDLNQEISNLEYDLDHQPAQDNTLNSDIKKEIFTELDRKYDCWQLDNLLKSNNII